MNSIRNNIFITSFERKIKVENIFKPERVDVYCSKKMTPITRSQLKTGLQSLFVNSRKAKLSRLINNGDIIEIHWKNPIPQYAAPEKIPFKIIYEDENVIVVNKDAGIVTHPANGHWNGTLVNALNYYRIFNSPYSDEFKNILNGLDFSKKNNTNRKFDTDLYRLGIVHRLDKETSGVIITARNFKMENFLKRSFKKRLVKKYYIAILRGCPENQSGRIKTSLFRSVTDRKKFTVSGDLLCGKRALSAYKILKTDGEYSLAVFRIFTGRTHQVRLHAKFLGCPVLGDTVYDKKYSVHTNNLFLHSYKLILNLNDSSDSKKKFTAPLPDYFKNAVEKIFKGL